MAIVVGVDCGTLSVPVTLLGNVAEWLRTASAAYPLHHYCEEPDFAPQSHADHIRALAETTKARTKTSLENGTA